MTDSAEKIPETADQWRMGLIKGFPFDGEHRDVQTRCEVCELAGLLWLEETAEDSSEREEYGETVWRLTDVGKKLYDLANTDLAPSRVTGDEVGEAVKMLIAMKADCEQKNMPEGYIAKWCINFCEKYADTIIQASRPTALDQLKAAVGDKYEIIEGMNDRGMQPPPEADRQRALEALEKLANTPMEISLADWQEIVRPILAYLTAPQPHVGVEVTRRSFYPELAPDNQKQILALCGTKKIIDGAEYEWRHGGAYGHSGWHLIIESEITAQKNGDENG